MQTSLDRRSFLRCATLLCSGLVALPALYAGRNEGREKALAVTIERQTVNSTSIASVGYHPRHRVLEIAFHSGAVYRYAAVPPTVFEALLKAESKGRYFMQHIRNRFTFHRVENEKP